MNHVGWVVNLFALVQNIKSLQVLALTVAFYFLLVLLVLCHPAKNWSLTMAAFALYENLSFTRELAAFLCWMAVLTAAMTTVRSYLLTHLSTWMMLVGLLARVFMTLNPTFVSTRKYIGALVQAKRFSSAYCFDLFLATSAFHKSFLKTLTHSIMTSFLTFMSTLHNSLANIVTFWHNSSTNDWWS